MISITREAPTHKAANIPTCDQADAPAGTGFLMLLIVAHTVTARNAVLIRSAAVP